MKVFFLGFLKEVYFIFSQNNISEIFILQKSYFYTKNNFNLHNVVYLSDLICLALSFLNSLSSNFYAFNQILKTGSHNFLNLSGNRVAQRLLHVLHNTVNKQDLISWWDANQIFALLDFWHSIVVSVIIETWCWRHGLNTFLIWTIDSFMLNLTSFDVQALKYRQLNHIFKEWSVVLFQGSSLWR